MEPRVTPSSPLLSMRRPQSTGSLSVTSPVKSTRVEYEVEPRVRRIEQQLKEKLPKEWQEFAGQPPQINYYDKRINTFRDNPDLKPSAAYVKHAVKQLREQLAQEKLCVLNDDELRAIVLQEWRTDMVRNVWQMRLNRHNSRDGPIVRRSKSGVVTVTSQPRSDEPSIVIDAMAQDRKNTRKVDL